MLRCSKDRQGGVIRIGSFVKGKGIKARILAFGMGKDKRAQMLGSGLI